MWLSIKLVIKKGKGMVFLFKGFHYVHLLRALRGHNLTLYGSKPYKNYSCHRRPAIILLILWHINDQQRMSPLSVSFIVLNMKMF